MSVLSVVAQRISDQINSDQLVLTAEIRDLAEEFRQAVAETERRLQRCERLVSLGLICEAVHLASVSPRLDEELNSVNFSDRLNWDVWAMNQGLPPAATISVERQEQLGRLLISHTSALESAIRAYREACLNLAPTAEQLNILRQLLNLDPTSPTWRKEIIAREKIRLEELGPLVDSALARNQTSEIEELSRELLTPGWVTAIPPLLLSRLNSVMGQQERERARAEFPKHVKRMQDARKANQLELLRQLATQVETFIQQAQLPPDDRVVAIARSEVAALAEVEAEIQRRQEFDIAIDDLRAALKYPNTSREKLEQLEKIAESYGYTVPSELSDLINERIEAITSTNRTREIIITIGILLGALGVIAAVIFIFILSR